VFARPRTAAPVRYAAAPWRWTPLNEVGSAIYSADLRYRSTVAFRSYDDGWHLVQAQFRSGQTIDDALKNAEPAR